MSLVATGVDVGSAIAESAGLIQYLLVFFFAAFPWIEILVVIPIGIGVGLDPALTGLVSFAGNVASVYLLILFHRHVSRWWASRRGVEDSRHDRAAESDDRARYRWGRSVWNRYGLPGLSLAAPVLTGVHLAALLAIAAGSNLRDIAGWMTVGIAIWTAALVVATVWGISVAGVA